MIIPIGFQIYWYHCEHHQGIIPAKGLDQPQSNETSQRNGNKRQGKEDDSHSENGLLATLKFDHLDRRWGSDNS